MSGIHKIVVPTDFSPHAAEAFRLAQTLAKALGASVTVVHVVTPPVVASDGGRVFTTATKGGAHDLMDDFRKSEARDPQVPVEHEVLVADKPVAAHLLEVINNMGCDLIVMGSHGRTGITHLLFGSVAEAVMRKARCPVVVVKAPEREPPVPPPVPPAKVSQAKAGK
jgi:nucleotide-binding universal stress UspA family protein